MKLKSQWRLSYSLSSWQESDLGEFLCHRNVPSYYDNSDDGMAQVMWSLTSCVILRETQTILRWISALIFFFSTSHKGSLLTKCLYCWLVHHKPYVGHNHSALPSYCWGIYVMANNIQYWKSCHGTPMCAFVLLWSYKIFQEYEMYIHHQVKCLPFVCDFNEIWLFLPESCKFQIPNLMTICPVGAESIRVDRHTDGHHEAIRCLKSMLTL